tara:strand:- start:282 stop:383 length:102 start_codon:yes stop_codon:yes gene_type:complete
MVIQDGTAGATQVDAWKQVKAWANKPMPISIIC